MKIRLGKCIYLRWAFSDLNVLEGSQGREINSARR